MKLTEDFCGRYCVGNRWGNRYWCGSGATACRKGALIAICDVNKDQGEATAAEVGGHFYTCDVADFDAWLTVFRGFGGMLRSRLSTMRLATRGARVYWRSRVRRGAVEAYELFLTLPGEPLQVLAEAPTEGRQDLEAFGHRLAYALETPLRRARSV